MTLALPRLLAGSGRRRLAVTRRQLRARIREMEAKALETGALLAEARHERAQAETERRRALAARDQANTDRAKALDEHAAMAATANGYRLDLDAARARITHLEARLANATSHHLPALRDLPADGPVSWGRDNPADMPTTPTPVIAPDHIPSWADTAETPAVTLPPGDFTWNGGKPKAHVVPLQQRGELPGGDPR